MGIDKYTKGYDPLLEGFCEVYFNDIYALKANFDDQTLGVVLKTVQGSEGLQIVSQEFMQEIRNLCDRHNALFIVNEVQTGMARTGRMFSFKHYGIQLDIIAVAKAMGGGFPIGGMFCQPKVAQSMYYGAHGSTYGGNPLACAASLAAVNTILDKNLSEASEKKGVLLRQRLLNFTQDIPSVKDIRGKGLMIGVELAFKGRPVVTPMMDQGVLSNCNSGNVLRLIPPLIISEEELDTLAHVLTRSIKKTAPDITN